jgi:hypothetical protein
MVEPGDLGQPQAPHDRLGRLVEDRGDRPDLRQADAVAFASRLMDAKDAVDLDTVRDDVAGGGPRGAGARPYLGVGQAGLAVCPHK